MTFVSVGLWKASSAGVRNMSQNANNAKRNRLLSNGRNADRPCTNGNMRTKGVMKTA